MERERREVRGARGDHQGIRQRGTAGGLCFFFQAEDGIRRLYVTGVQTCALPISTRAFSRPPAYTAFATPAADVGPALSSALPAPPPSGAPELPMTLEEFYGGFTFHGPRMQAIQSIEQISPQG